MSPLLAVPNVSEGRDRAAIATIEAGFAARVLDLHSDPDHNRSVITLAGEPGELAPAVLAGAIETLRLVDLRRHAGLHPRVGALDVAPIVYLEPDQRGAACAEALVLADMLAQALELPVFLYGELAGGRTRAEIRRGGVEQLARRMAAGELTPDFGPSRIHPRAGATLVAARAPLVAFNIELGPPASLETARAIAARIREGGEEGLASVRAIGLWLERRGVAQVSTNIEDHTRSSPAAVIEAIARHAAPAQAELVGLAPAASLADLPPELPVRNRRTIEEALAH